MLCFNSDGYLALWLEDCYEGCQVSSVLLLFCLLLVKILDICHLINTWVFFTHHGVVFPWWSPSISITLPWQKDCMPESRTPQDQNPCIEDVLRVLHMSSLRNEMLDCENDEAEVAPIGWLW